MQNKAIIIITVIAVLGIIGSYMTLQHYQPQSTVQVQSNVLDVETSENNGVLEPGNLNTKTLSELFNTDAALRCTANIQENDTSTVGEIYLTKDNFRGSFKLTDDADNKYTSNVLKRGMDVYVWTDENPAGYKFVLEEDENVLSLESLSYLSENDQFDCEPDTISESRFDVPTNIEFQEFSTTFSDLLENKDLVCSFCESAGSEEARNLCREQLSC